MRKAEPWLVFVLWLALVAVFAQFFYVTTAMKHLDSVFLFQGVASILQHGVPTSGVVASWQDAVQYFQMAPDRVCAADLALSDRVPYNVLHNHAYAALYPIALISSLIGAERAFAVLNAAAHLSVVFLPYLFLRRQGLGGLPSIVFAFLVTAYAGWSLSGLGDYYLDRLYLPFMLLLLYLLHGAAESGRQKGAGWQAAVLLTAIAAGCMTERSAMMVLGTSVFFLVFYPGARSETTIRRLLLVLLVLGSAYVLLYLTQIYRGIEGGGDLVRNASDVAALKAKLQHPAFVSFLTTNFLILGGLAFFSGIRNIALLAGAMLPNVALNIGGAELTGWTTHYHAMYIPFLIFAASVGYLWVIRQLPKPSAALACVLMALCAAGVVRYYDPYTSKWERTADFAAGFGVTGSVYRFFTAPASSAERAVSDWTRTLDEIVPHGVNVSAIEGAMPVLYRDRGISMYPTGMDSADYLVIGGTAQNGVITSTTGAISYLGQAAVDELNSCLSRRATREGFALFRAIPAIGVLVLKRVESGKGT